MKFSVAIVDDDFDQAQALGKLIRELGVPLPQSLACLSATDGYEAPIHSAMFDVAVFDSIATMECALSRRTVDIALIGIQLPGIETGIDAVSRLFPRGASTQVIYMTRYPQYHAKVYATDHMGFLLKPINIGELKEALEQAMEQIMQQSDRPICVFSGSDIHIVLPEEIRYLESTRRILHIHADKVIDTYATIAQFAKLLPRRFFSCHKSFLINPDYVRALIGNHLELSDGEDIPISQRRRAFVRQRLSAYGRGI